MGWLAEQLGDEAFVREELATKVLGATFAIALLVVVVLAVAPLGAGEQYTEFYILGPDGVAADYPQNVTVGENASVRVGIKNHENSAQTYTLVVRTTETRFVSRTIDLDIAETWEQPVPIVFDDPGRKQLLFELYVGQSTSGEPYRKLWVFVEVTAR